MKITDIVSYTGKAGAGPYYVKVETDEGVFGFGECSNMFKDGIREIIHRRIKHQLVGMDPFDIEKIEQATMTKNYKFSGQLLAMAFSGIEIALWDLKGKYLNQPIYNLLGGRFRDKIKMYGSSMTRDINIEQECEKIRNAIDVFGFEAVKIKVGPRFGNTTSIIDMDKDVEKVRVVREVIGKERKLLLDANSSFTYFQAVKFYEQIEKYNIYHYEEPCPYYDVESYVKLSQKLSVPINVGEQDWSLYTFRDFISRGACQICAGDLTKCGGYINAKRLAALCRAFGIIYSPHNTSRGIGMAAHIQFIAATPECNYYHEFNVENLNSETYLAEKYIPVNGILEVPYEPGLGIELDIEKMERNMDKIR